MHRTISAFAAAAALALAPATALADHGGGQGNHGSDHGGHHGRDNHAVAWEARGTVSAVDATANTITIAVPDRRGATNHHAAAWRGQTVTFSLAGARLDVRDVNGDGQRDLADVAAGDSVRVLAMLPATLGATDVQPFAAKRVTVRHPHQRTEPTETESSDGANHS
jgi:hypothetical protein